MKLISLKRLAIWLIITPTVLFFSIVLMAYLKQGKIVQNLVHSFNDDFIGEVQVKGSHISPFENFPYISIDLEGVVLFESKKANVKPILDIKDVYVGFNILDLISGNYDIKVIELKDGFIHAVQDKEGQLNIVRAISSEKDEESVEEDFNIHLKAIKLINIDVYKLNKANNLKIESFVKNATVGFKSNDEHVLASLFTHTEISVFTNGKSTFVKKKHLNLDLEIEYIKEEELIIISPSELQLEDATFSGEGSIELANDFNLDLKLYGKKKNFDLFIAMAPEELISTLKTYENAGNIEFEVNISGKSSVGYTPLLNATFSCENAFVENNESHKKIDQLSFSGYFTNNGKKGMENMEFSLINFNAKPAAGNFSADLLVKNFETPDIELTLDSEFDLGFLSEFINSTDFENIHGNVNMHMKFHDIIDLSNPEKSIEKLNEAYYTELIIADLGFKTSSYHLPLSALNTRIVVEGNEAKIEYFNAKVGTSDLNISGNISDLPALIHHLDNELIIDLDIKSSLLDIKELTTSEVEVNEADGEKINDLVLKLKFKGSAKKIIESPNLPVGEFFIENLYFDLNHYPHTFHDFKADFLIGNENFEIIDFSGMIDKSDFHFNGKLANYSYLLDEHPEGNVLVDFDLTSKLLKLEDLFSYNGENFMPEDYRHEELSEVKVHGNVDLLFNDGLKSSDLYITQIDAKLKMHPMKLNNFNGRVHLEGEQLAIQDLSGQMGRSKFTINMNYFVGEAEENTKSTDFLKLKSSRLDFDELFNYTDPPKKLANEPSEHEEVFNIYSVPFPDMAFEITIQQLNYHRYFIQNFEGKLRTTSAHYLYVDTLSMDIAEGKMMMSGYFNGSNKDEIYFSPKLKLKGIDLGKLLFKFENFGQDYLVSENIQGKITSTISGKIRMHADLVPILDKSEVHMDLNMYNGRLIDYEPIVDLKEYFVDKNVNNVRFDTLSNHIDLVNGTMTIPNMTINSTLGFMVVSGTQDMEGNMEYYIKVPLKLIVNTGYKSLFGKSKKEVNVNQEDEIEYLDPTKKTAFVNIKIVGDSEDFTVSLGKDKRKKKR